MTKKYGVIDNYAKKSQSINFKGPKVIFKRNCQKLPFLSALAKTKNVNV